MSIFHFCQPSQPGVTTMKQTKEAGNTHIPPMPLNPQHIQQHAQTEATAGREQVREVTPVRAPRESKRAAERSGKGPSGN